MRIAPRLLLAFGVLGAIPVAALGWAVRQNRVEVETQRFDADVKAACARITEEIQAQGERDKNLLAGACKGGELVGRVVASMDRGDFAGWDPARVLPDLRVAFDMNELALVSGDAVLGADPVSLVAHPPVETKDLLAPSPPFLLRVGNAPALVTGCAKKTSHGQHVALVAARYLAPILERQAKTLGVSVGEPRPGDDAAIARCRVEAARSVSMPLVVTKSKAALHDNLSEIDRRILLAAMASTGLALLLAVLLARSLSRPIEELAHEARKVALGQAKPMGPRGSGEIAELAASFDKMLLDLDALRVRLAATSRVAAWREVARRVAHEIKNPLAPIQAAVETLRRLRARRDPAFDEYFDEASRTVLAEVHRISHIVTEFTRFARLPAPSPTNIEVKELARQVVALQEAAHPRVAMEIQGEGGSIRADRDQLVQVLTNLVQNAAEALAGMEDARVEILLAKEGDSFRITVKDNGPGVPAAWVTRLFEPYATTKAEGTGLGLAIAQRIALEHDGELVFEGVGLLHSPSRPGVAFRLVLPVSGPAEQGKVET